MTISAETTEAALFEPRHQSQADLISAILAFNATGHRPFTANEIGEWSGLKWPTEKLTVFVERGWFEVAGEGHRYNPTTYLLTEGGAHRARLALADWEVAYPDQAAAA